MKISHVLIIAVFVPVGELVVQVEIYLFQGKYSYDIPCHKFECLFNLDSLREFLIQ